MDSLYQRIEKEALANNLTMRTKESMDWFRKNVSRLTRAGTRINRQKLIQSSDLRGDPSNPKTEVALQQHGPGSMYNYYYDPKHKKTLPYYDRFPLIIMVDKAKDGFYGLNLHYIPPLLRARLLDALTSNINNRAFNQTTKMNVNYGILKSTAKYKYYKPCFKHYLTKHIRSEMALVMPDYWEIATFLPTALWEKKTATEVYKLSREMI